AMMADLMEAAGSPTAVGWRVRVAQLEPQSAERRFQWARTALRARDFNAASEALSGLDERARKLADCHKLMGALHSGLERPVEAEKHFREALRLEPGSLITMLNLATLRLNSTNAEVASLARATLQQMGTNAEMRIVVLERLKTDAVFRQAFPEAIAYSDKLIREPRATIDSRMDHLRLLRKTRSQDYEAYFKVLKEEGARSSVAAYTLARWMAMTDGPTNALSWVRSLPPTIRTNEPVPLVVADCQILMKDWRGLLSLTERTDWGQSEFYRLALLSLAQRSLNQKLAADASWRKAFRQADRRLDRLTWLLKVAENSGWKDETAQVLREVTGTFPGEKWALDRLTMHLYAAGDTRAIHLVLSKAHESNPADPMLKNNLAYVCLLLGTDLNNAHRLVKEAFEQVPEDDSVLSTYAYSLFLQGKRDEAVSVAKRLKPEALKSPSVAACFSVINARAGNKSITKEPLLLAEAARLLPEEKELVRQARASL
ncbi:MAG: hypothetical protein H7Y43_08600, partial [Akkermansiaceae bacterium]|nr:hypothetical protein [Verrucomicrobiales bacterium]